MKDKVYLGPCTDGNSRHDFQRTSFKGLDFKQYILFPVSVNIGFRRSMQILLEMPNEYLNDISFIIQRV